MNKKAKTANVAGKGSVLSVKAGKPQVKKFDVPQAQTVEAEEIKAEEKPQEEPQPVAPEPQPQEATVTEAPKQQEIATVSKTVEKPTPTMEEIKDVAQTLYLLQDKHTKLIEKRQSLKKFDISHDPENVKISIKDANGLEFKSSSPKTIARLLEFWDEEFADAQKAVETKIKDLFLGAA